AGIPLELIIPIDHPRSYHRSTRGGRRTVNFSHKLLSALQELGRREGATLFVILLAAFKALLYRYSGEEDIIVSAPVANRSRKDHRRLIGCFANRLLLRTRLQNNWTIHELIQAVRDVTLSALANQDLPLSQVEKLIPYQGEPAAPSHVLS